MLILLMIISINSCLTFKTQDYNDDEPSSSSKAFYDIIDPTTTYTQDTPEEEEIPIITGLISQNYLSLNNYEPQVPKTVKETFQEDEKRIDCETFDIYVRNCTLQSAMIYNSSRKSPPMPAKMEDWCSAIRHLTNCAVVWNSECTDVTENHFNEESVKGHMHVVNNICDDEYFRTRYDELPHCIDSSSKAWEECYVAFKSHVDELKNQTKEWTHYKTHFQLCCARTKFRRCTLDALFINKASICTREEAMMLQKFSVFTSAGEVFQDCETNMMFDNCTGGDPRPSSAFLSTLMNGEVEMRAANKVKLALHEDSPSKTVQWLNSYVHVVLSVLVNVLK